MKNHTVDLNDLLSWETENRWHNFASVIGSKGTKHLQIFIGGTSIRVVYNKRVKYEGTDAEKAVEIYNQIPL
jgi:hypothetical protein